MSLAFPRHIPVTGRSVERITNLHGLSLEVFEDANVYDLGCGMSDIGAELAFHGIKSVVTGFDTSSQALSSSTGHTRSTVKIYSPLDNLAAEDNSADVVIASYSLPLWGRTADQINNFFYECQRVVRVGGLLSIYPLTAHGRQSKRQTRKRVSEIKSADEWEYISTHDRVLTARKIQ